MIRCLERPLLADSPLARDDFCDFQAFVEALREAGKSTEEAPLRRLAQILVSACSRPDLLLLPNVGTSGGPGFQPGAGPGLVASPPHPTPFPGAGDGDGEAVALSVLWDLLRHYHFHREPLFAGLKPLAPDAEVLLGASRPGGRALDAGDQLWLNRHLLEAAFRQATGHACFRRLNSGLDGVLVSDVGQPIAVQGNRRAGGLIRTSMRATDIVMDRVWQLEIDMFRDTPGFVFAPITEMVEPAEDPTALHPEIQRQTARIRTDLDRFSLLEISSLVRHGYCVGRKACRARPDLFGAELPNGGPWDPVPEPRDAALKVPAATRPSRLLQSPLLGKVLGGREKPAAATVEARTLQDSAPRRIWSSLLDYRDWVSYLYVPILVPILTLLPYFVFKSYQRSHRMSQIVESLAQSNRDLDQMTLLLDGPVPPWVGVPPEEVPAFDEPDYTGFDVLQDMRILDLRNWNPVASGKSDASSTIYGYRRLKVVKTPENGGNNHFRVQLLQRSPLSQVRFPPQQVPARARVSNAESSAPGQKERAWEASFDFEKVPTGEYVDLIIEYISPGQFLKRGETSTSFPFEIDADTAEVTRWLLLPRGKEYRDFRIVRYKTGMPSKVEEVNIITKYLAEDSTILAYKLLSVDGGYTYEVTWFYK